MRRREWLGLFIFDRMRKLDVVSLQPGTQPSGFISCYLHGWACRSVTAVNLGDFTILPNRKSATNSLKILCFRL